jgi:hypothetical protein
VPIRLNAVCSYSGSKQHEATLTFKKVGTLKKFTTSGGLEYNSKKAFAQVEFDSTNYVWNCIPLIQMFGTSLVFQYT